MKQRKQYREHWVVALQNADFPVRLTAGMTDPISGAHMMARYKTFIPNADVLISIASLGMLAAIPFNSAR
ncbi:alpha/beta hydrolase [Alteromonas mediterranea]|uniref:alpha/beta hydrolase n=1 Tax=Alteromonas mediterranea TaxID=314275 RepID=UPI00241E49FB|nr:alpha/beta hydrolase [Alteromonas mediterranea]